MTSAEQNVTSEVEKDFPFMDNNKVEVRYNETGRGTGAIIGIKMRAKTKWYPLLTKTREDAEKTFNTNLLKEIQSALDRYRGIKIKDAEIQQKDEESKRLRRPNKRTNGLQMTTMNNLRYVRKLVTKLQMIQRERKPGRSGARTSCTGERTD